MDAVEYEFDVRSASHMQDVTMLDSVMKGDFPPVLEIDETELDENNDLRFVGRMDYQMKISARGRALQEKNRLFNYKWEWDSNEGGVQYPAVYKKNRFSLGIKRHREKFQVVVAALLVSRGRDFDGVDVSNEYKKGALEVLRLCKELNITKAILKANSPSCGCGTIYDGTFSGTKIKGNGITAQLLIDNGIEVLTEKDI